MTLKKKHKEECQTPLEELATECGSYLWGTLPTMQRLTFIVNKSMTFIVKIHSSLSNLFRHSFVPPLYKRLLGVEKISYSAMSRNFLPQSASFCFFGPSFPSNGGEAGSTSTCKT
jgi:hypothetical protein